MGETIPRGACTAPAGAAPRIAKQRHLSPEFQRLPSMERRIAHAQRSLARFLGEVGA
jgi:hypothetical protein